MAATLSAVGEPADLHAIELPDTRPLSRRERAIDLAFVAFALVLANCWAFIGLR